MKFVFFKDKNILLFFNSFIYFLKFYIRQVILFE